MVLILSFLSFSAVTFLVKPSIFFFQIALEKSKSRKNLFSSVTNTGHMKETND